MKISTKGRYGLRAMIDLAVYSKDRHVSLNNIAERQGISTNYLEHVFSVLKKSGLVISVKGAQGGYMLSKDPSEIDVGQILRVLEGPLSVVDENINNEHETIIRHCLRINVWNKMNVALNDLVDSITLKHLADKYRNLNGSEEMMYYI